MSTVNPARQVFQRPAGAPSSAPVAASPLAAPPVDPFRVLRKHVTAIVASGVFGILLGVGLYVGLGAFFPAYTGIVRFEVVGNLKDANQATPSDLDRDDVVIRLARTEIAFILSRQVLTDAVNDPDRAAAKRAFDAMMTMRKIDVAAIEKAWRGEARRAR